MYLNRYLLVLVFAFSFGSLLQVSNGANILFFFGVSTYSHRIVVWPLVEKLAAMGHSVTFFSPFYPKQPNPNVTEFVPKELSKFMNDFLGQDSDLVGVRFAGDHKSIWHMLPILGIQVCEVLFQSQESIDWMNSKKFDLVVIDALLNDCGLGLAYKFKAQHIIFDTTAPFMWQNDVFGFNLENSWIPDQQQAFHLPMTFLHRVENTVRALGWYFMRTLWMFPKLEEIMKKEISDLPSLGEFEKTGSLVLTNTHYSIDYPRPLPANIIPIAGLHIHDKFNPLPKDMENFIQGYKEGFVYISFGSAAQISKLSSEFQNEFFNALRKFDQVGFVWKWEGPRPKNMPKNVFLADWMPQQDILAHKKVKGFITHGGLMSIEEAVLNGVPLIVFPIFAEQDYNAEKVNRVGYGISVEITTVTQKILENAISGILYDKKYSDTVKIVSKLFKDRQNKPLDTAIWWVEFVLRTKESREFLTPLGITQTWYQRRLLDVWGFLLLLIITPVFLTLLFSFWILTKCCKSNKSQNIHTANGTKKVKKQ